MKKNLFWKIYAIVILVCVVVIMFFFLWSSSIKIDIFIPNNKAYITKVNKITGEVHYLILAEGIWKKAGGK